MRQKFLSCLIGLGLLIVLSIGKATAQQFTCLHEVATGEGMLESENGDRLCINAVAAVLRENGSGEVCLMTPNENIHLGGRWWRSPGTSSMIEFEIADDTKGEPIAGCATLFLQNDCVPIAGLTMTAVRAGGKSFWADFREKKLRACGTEKTDSKIISEELRDSVKSRP